MPSSRRAILPYTDQQYLDNMINFNLAALDQNAPPVVVFMITRAGGEVESADRY